MNVFDLYARIVLDPSDYKKGLDDAGKKTNSFSDDLKKGLSKAAKAGAAAIGAASAAVGFLVKSSIEGYAEYEQLVGGVETLFKVSSDVVMGYAENAYKTAGLSANQYMNTVTSFSASLLASLGNDTAKAAAMADLAVTDMADNANKMGTSIESIQNAYQGFAKQNYTMLDNLKLGYGGTKTEMERLLADAEELKAANGEMVSYSIDSFADMVEAIHVVQTEMGITGTTALEASTTIQGSVSAMKSAWSNLVTGIADDNADFDTLIGNFVESVSVAGQNILPRVEVALNGAASLVQKLFPVIAQQVPQIINDTLPQIVTAAVGIVDSLITGITENQDALFDTAISVIGMLADSFVSALPRIIEFGTELIVSLINAISSNPDKLVDTAIQLISVLVGGLISALPQIITAGAELIAALVRSLVDKWPEIKEAGSDLLEKLKQGLIETIDSLVSVGSDIVGSIRSGISAAWDGLVSWFTGIWDSLFGNLTANVSVATHGGGGGKVDIPGHATGLDYVPYDNYLARLHKGEAVLTAKEASAWRSGEGPGTGNGLTVIQNIYSEAKTASDLMREARWEAEMAVLMGA